MTAPPFSFFFKLACNTSTNNLFLPNVIINGNSYSSSLLVKNITNDSLIVDITSLIASLPPLLPNASSSGQCQTSQSNSSTLWLPQSPGLISVDNEFGSFGCIYGSLITNEVLPSSPPPYSPPLPFPPAPAPSPLPLGSPAEAPAAPPTVDDVASDYYYDYNFADVQVGGCAVKCSDYITGDERNVSLCGQGHDICCVSPFDHNSAARFTWYSVMQSPVASNISCSGGTNYATLFHRSSSNLDKGIYYLKLMWALPSNHTQSQTELMQSPEYACYMNSNLTIVDGVPGYLCYCNSGYKGDGYQNGSGCQEINECNDPAYSNDCVSTSLCDNKPAGDYTCRCNTLLHVGDGRKHGSGCQISRSLILGLEIGAVFVILSLMLGIFFCLAIWWRKRTKKMYFMQHGGLELQEILRSRAGGEMRIFKEEELKSAIMLTT